jgi:hypothetical protein
MRHIILGLLFATFTSSVGVQSQSKLDDPIAGDFRVSNPLRPCAFGTAVDQVAWKANVLLGFENTLDCLASRRSLFAGEDAVDLKGKSAREAFDHLMTLVPTYRWQEMDGVVVVRPTAAWDDPTNVLTLPTASFSLTSAHMNDVLHVLLRSVTPSVFFPHTDKTPAHRSINQPISVAFQGGTMLEALNAVVRAHQRAAWELGHSDRAHIRVKSLEVLGEEVGAPLARAIPQN